MSDVTDERLAELAALAAAATPGPWRSAEGDLEGKTVLDFLATLLGNREKDGTTTGRLFLTLARNDIDPGRGAEVVPCTTGDGPRSEANAAFIAATNPQAVLALLADLTEARAEVERLTEALSASEGERDDLDMAVGTLLGENVELEAELATTRETLRRVEAVEVSWSVALSEGRCPSCSQMPETDCDHGEGFHHAWGSLAAALAQSAQEGQG